MYNQAILTNEGTLTCTNYGTVYSVIGATTNVTDNYGTIEVKTADAAGLTIAGERGNVQYIATQSADDFTNSLVTNVYFEGDYTILGGEINSLNFWGSEATLTLNNPTDPSAEGCKVNELCVISGGLTLASDMGIDALSVGGTGELIIPEGVTLTYNGSDYFGNSGRIVVRGTLIAPNIMEGGFNGDGTIDVEGGEVIWGNQSEESAE